jgi:hypothetical protein
LLSRPRPLRYAVVQFLFLASIAGAVFNAQTVVPFIYFQF